MVSHFRSPNKRGTSARIEGYFASLKTSILSKKSLKMRVDKFLVTHLRAIRGDVKLAQGTIDYDHFDQTPKKIDGLRINEQEDNQLPKKNCIDELVMYNSERPKIYEISCNNSEDRSLDDYSFKDFMCGESNNLKTDFGIEVEKVTEKNMIFTSSDDIFQSNTVNDVVIIDNEDELTVENWRNKAVPSKKNHYTLMIIQKYVLHPKNTNDANILKSLVT